MPEGTGPGDQARARRGDAPRRVGLDAGPRVRRPHLYEGTGVAGQSQLRELDPETGAVRRAVSSPNNFYGEGITVVGDRIWELTWQNGVAVEFDKATMTPLREVPISGEGWGCATQGTG